MASTFVNNLRLNEMATGDASGSWGTNTNINLELIGEALGYGTEAITTNADTHSKFGLLKTPQVVVSLLFLNKVLALTSLYPTVR